MRGYKEEGTTTTPFDMVMLNDLDRFHLVMDVIDRVPGLAERAGQLRQDMADERLRHRAYTREHGEDPPDVTDWCWPAPSIPGTEQDAHGIGRSMRVLVVNAGSSSLKLTLLDGEDATIAARELEAPRAQVDPEELRAALDSPLGEADAIGHRIVHGGERFREAVRIDADVETAMRELIDLAPLHQPKSLAALDAVTERCRPCPRSRALTPPFTRACRRRHLPTHCRRSGASAGGCVATAFTVSRTLG